MSDDDEPFDQLHERFDTSFLLRLVDMIDEIGARAGDPSGLRLDVLKFHALAHRLINEFPGVASSDSLQELASGAFDLGMELGEWADRLQEASDWLDSLADAIPDEE